MEQSLRVVFVGNVDSGKSTLISVLSKKKLDNGRGLARQSVFNHPHETESGRTSSISMEFCKISNKKSILIDLCGHEKYLKTTLFGLNLTRPDYCILVIGANMGISKMTIDHLNSALALGFNIIICLTKIDICPKHILKATVDNIKKLCERYKKHIINYNENTYNVINNDLKNKNSIIPFIQISNVTGEGINHLENLISKLNPINKYLLDERTEYVIDNYYNVKGVGLVVAGTITRGTVSVGDKLFLNISKNNSFTEIGVKSIYNEESCPTNKLVAGQHCTINIKESNKKKTLTKNDLQKGMVIVSKNSCTLAREFIAIVYIFHHQTTITKKSEKKSGFQPIINCNGIRQSAEMVDIYNKSGLLRSNDKCKVRFKFMYHKEYLINNSKFIFREGTTRGIGKIIEILPNN